MADFMADDTADRCATDGSDRTAAGKHGAAYGAYAGADSSILVLPRHAGTSAQTEQH